jgi:hypothetical protein
MAFFVDQDSHGAGGDARTSALARDDKPQSHLDAGATLSLSHFEEFVDASRAVVNAIDPHALHLPDDAEIRVISTSHYRAKMFIPCVGGRCPGRMQLRVADTRNVPLPRAYYLCERKDCIHSHVEHCLYPDEMRSDYVMEAGKKRYYKSNEARTRDEMRTML